MKFNSISLRLEIGAVLILKFILIFTIKALFFSDPVARDLNEQDVSQRLIGAGPTEAAPNFNSEVPCHVERRDC